MPILPRMTGRKRISLFAGAMRCRRSMLFATNTIFGGMNDVYDQ